MELTEIVTKKDLENLKEWFLLNVPQNVLKMEPMPEFIPESKAAEMIGVSKKTLQNWKYLGKITSYKVAGTCVTSYKYSDIVALQSEVKCKSNKEINTEANTRILKKRIRSKRIN